MADLSEVSISRQKSRLQTWITPIQPFTFWTILAVFFCVILQPVKFYVIVKDRLGVDYQEETFETEGWEWLFLIIHKHKRFLTILKNFMKVLIGVMRGNSGDYIW